MNADDLLRLAQSGDFIEGIYNYCDRWCERCPQSARCIVYAQEKADRGDDDSQDSKNEAFWDRLANSMKTAGELLQRMAAERGLDISAASLEAANKQEVTLQERLEQEPLPRLAHQYAEKADQWFNDAAADFEAKGDELRSIEEMDIEGSDPVADADDISDCVEIIRWYQYQITVKLMRAYSGFTRSLVSNLPHDLDLDGLQEKLAAKAVEVPVLRELLDPIADESDLLDDDDEDLGEDAPFAADSEVVDDEWGDIGQDDPEFEAALEAAERNDSDGSAKVALIAIERSIGAWTRLRAHLPDRADELLDLLVMLDRLRRATDAQFPAARAFKRPGFDD